MSEEQRHTRGAEGGGGGEGAFARSLAFLNSVQCAFLLFVCRVIQASAAQHRKGGHCNERAHYNLMLFQTSSSGLSCLFSGFILKPSKELYSGLNVNLLLHLPILSKRISLKTWLPH